MKAFDSSQILVGESGPTPAGSSNTAMLLRCQKLYQYWVIRKLRQPAIQTPAHFAVGSLFAAMRRTWFGLNFDSSEKAWRNIKKACEAEAKSLPLPVSPVDEQYALWLMQEYMNHWLKQARPRVLAAEYYLEANLSDDEAILLDRTGRLDDLSYYPEAGGALCVGEAKTTSADIGSVVREYEFHVQTLQYRLLYLLDPNGQKKFGPVSGTVLDVAQKSKKPFFQRVYIEVPEQAVRQFHEDLQYHVRVAKDMTWDSEPPRSYQCTYMAGRARVDCPFKEVCKHGRAAAGRYMLEGGTVLHRYKPVKGARKMPWE